MAQRVGSYGHIGRFAKESHRKMYAENCDMAEHALKMFKSHYAQRNKDLE